MIFKKGRSQSIHQSLWIHSVVNRLWSWLKDKTAPMTTWSRMGRASIVLVGMLLAIILFWLHHFGWAVAIGITSFALFWLSVVPRDIEEMQINKE